MTTVCHTVGIRDRFRGVHDDNARARDCPRLHPLHSQQPGADLPGVGEQETMCTVNRTSVVVKSTHSRLKGRGATAHTLALNQQVQRCIPDRHPSQEPRSLTALAGPRRSSCQSRPQQTHEICSPAGCEVAADRTRSPDEQGFTRRRVASASTSPERVLSRLLADVRYVG